MPGMDGTGPFGNGPQGRGRGPCGNGEPIWGRGRGLRRGAGMGRRWMATQSDPPDEKILLEQQKTLLEAHLSNIKERLEKIEKPPSE
jgi:hypothetical protein